MKSPVGAALVVMMLALGPAAVCQGQEPGLLVHLNFDEVQGNHYVDQSPAHLPAPIFGAEPCEGVSGTGVRIPGNHRSVNVDLPPEARNLDAVTVEAWVSPDDAHFATMITAPRAPTALDLMPFMLRWRTNWQFWFQVFTPDGEERVTRTNGPGMTVLSRPKRTWAHVVGTYDGETVSLYVNGRQAATTTYKTGRKPLMPIDGPVQVGGRGEAYRGCLDEVRIYRRALSAAEVQAHYAAAADFQPAAPAGQAELLPGTIDGQPYGHAWQTVRIAQGNLLVSNNGLITPESSPQGAHVQMGFYPLNLAGQGSRGAKFFSEVSGNLELRADGSANLLVEGRTTHNLQIKETLEVNPEGDAHLRYEITALNPNAPKPIIDWPQHLWPSAIRFVSNDAQGPVTGTFMDMDEELQLQDLTELNLMRGQIRAVFWFGPGTVWRLHGTRQANRWLNGYTTFPAELIPAEWKSWAETPTAVIELALRLEPDNLPPRLDRANAREVTKSVPFDFSALYQGDPKLLRLEPEGEDLPVWLEGDTVRFRVAVPEEMAPKAQSYAWVLADAFTAAQTSQGTLPAEGREVRFPAPPGGAYVLRLQALDGEQKPLGECASEVVVAGEIPQRRARPGERLPLRKVDEVDFTQADPGHDFFSFSGASKVEGTGRAAYRRTLTFQEAYLHAGGGGGWRGMNDWFGVRFKTEPGKIYVLETEYPDRDGMSISLYLNEPKDDPTDGKAKPITRTGSGLFTGGYLPFDNTMKTFQTVHFASAPWFTATYQNGHCERTGTDRFAPCCIRRATLYEVVNGDLPRLDAPDTADRLLGVHAESGGLALCSFSPERFRGELGNWNDRPKPEEFYRRAYAATANLIRYMRYRGDTALYYGVYRYRAAMFPSRLWPPSNDDWAVDLPALMARMFERNGLKLVLVNQPTDPLPVARLHQNTRWDVAHGASATVPVDLNGDHRTAAPQNPTANPFNEQVIEAYASLMAEEGKRYGKYPAVAGAGFICGDSWMEPCLPQLLDGGKPDLEENLLRTPYDDETMRRFQEWARLEVPVDPEDPQRFRKRHDWILQNAKDQYLRFRGWATAQSHLAFAKALRQHAPNQDYLFMDFYGQLFMHQLSWPYLEAVKRFSADPQYLRGPGFVHMPYLPQANGTRLFEHAPMSLDLMPQLTGYIHDDGLATAWDTEGRSARYVHRQFYEQGLDLPADRKWIWDPATVRMSTCSYPQEGGRTYLADFALTMARSTPNYFCYMWCDSTIPLGMEPQHQEFARLFRSLPAGHYREADRQDGVFCRYLDRPATFYVVNTQGKTVLVDGLKTGVRGTFVEVNTGAEVSFEQGQGSFELQAYEMKVYLRK